MNFVDQIIAAAEAAGQSTQELLTHEFRAFALEQGWPADVVGLCTVRHTGDQFVVSVDPECYERVLDWEHGTQDREAHPAMTRFMNRLDEYEALYEANLQRSLRDFGVA